MSTILRIATRKSPLALWQASHVRDQLLSRHPGLEVELLGMVSRGDQLLDSPLAKVGGKGLFVKELETALLDGAADIAVHSMKDMPMALPQGLRLGAVCAREDPSDAFVSNRCGSLSELPPGSVVGTSSLRRECQLRRRHPDLRVQFLRGNIDTRLQKLDEGEYDGILLATAGLLRLGLGERVSERLAAETFLPACGQGAVGVELRDNDPDTAALMAPLQHEPTARCVRAERALSARLQGGCQVPLACFAEYQGEGILWLRGMVGRRDGSEILCAESRASHDDPEALGIAVAEDLLGQGAGALLAEAADAILAEAKDE